MSYIADNDAMAQGTITTQNLNPNSGTATASSSVELACNGKGGCMIQVTGTYTGPLSLQATIDGTNWVTVGMASAIKNVNTDTYSTTIASASTGIFFASCAGYVKIRITALAAVTGTATVSMNLSRAARTVTMDSAIPAGTNILGQVQLQPSANQGNTLHAKISTADVNATNVKSSAGTVMAGLIANKALTGMWLKLYDKATAPVVGTDVPVCRVFVGASSTLPFDFGPNGGKFVNGIGYGMTSTDANTDTVGVLAAQCYLTLVYA